jgi:hypothetical protein
MRPTFFRGSAIEGILARVTSMSVDRVAILTIVSIVISRIAKFSLWVGALTVMVVMKTGGLQRSKNSP